MSTSRALMALLAVVVVAAGMAACGNVTTTTSTAGNTDGVFPHKIVLGGLASLTGPLPADFAPAFAGVRAYLDMVNAEGGVNGRRLDFAYPLDDQSSPTVDASQARALVDQYHVFAVVGVATPSFSGASFLASHDVPTFGYDVNPNSQWLAGPSLFGSTGSYTDFTAPQLQAVYLAEKHHVKSAAVLAYDISESQQGCEGVVNGFHRYWIPIAVEDMSIPAPATNLYSDVARMRAAGVGMVVSCLDVGGNVLLSDTMHQEGMSGVTQLWFDGYDQRDLEQFPVAMDGVYFLLQQVPFEVAKLDPGVYPGMDEFVSMLQRYEPGSLPSVAALAGWTSAALFVKGLRLIGHDVTRTRLVAALNRITDFTADGVMPPVDWRTGHDRVNGPTNCSAFVQVQGDRFVPVYGTPPSVLSCFPVPPPAKGPIARVVPLPAGVPPLGTRGSSQAGEPTTTKSATARPSDARAVSGA